MSTPEPEKKLPIIGNEGCSSSSSSNISSSCNNKIKDEQMDITSTDNSESVIKTGPTITKSSDILSLSELTDKLDSNNEQEIVDIEMDTATTAVNSDLNKTKVEATTSKCIKEMNEEKNDLESDKSFLHKDIENNIEKILDCFSEDKVSSVDTGGGGGSGGSSTGTTIATPSPIVTSSPSKVEQ